MRLYYLSILSLFREWQAPQILYPNLFSSRPTGPETGSVAKAPIVWSWCEYNCVALRSGSEYHHIPPLSSFPQPPVFLSFTPPGREVIASSVPLISSSSFEFQPFAIHDSHHHPLHAICNPSPARESSCPLSYFYPHLRTYPTRARILPLPMYLLRSSVSIGLGFHVISRAGTNASIFSPEIRFGIRTCTCVGEPKSRVTPTASDDRTRRQTTLQFNGEEMDSRWR